jgi:hypothetical protein
MADGEDRISYAIAFREDGKLNYTAREEEAATLPIYWMALPD